MMMKLWPSSFSETTAASFFSSRLRASSWWRWPSNFFLLPSVARKALPRGSKKLRAKPSLTRTVSPIWPSLATRSNKITSMSNSFFVWVGVGVSRAELRGGRASPERSHAFDQADRRDRGQHPLGRDEASHIERGDQRGAPADAARECVQDRQSLQDIDDAEAADEQGGELAGRLRRREPGPQRHDQYRAERRRRHQRSRHVGPGPGQPLRKLGRARRGVEVHREHQRRRARDRGRREFDDEAQDVVQRETVRQVRRAERLFDRRPQKRGDGLDALLIAAIDDDHRDKRAGADRNADAGRHDDEGADAATGARPCTWEQLSGGNGGSAKRSEPPRTAVKSGDDGQTPSGQGDGQAEKHAGKGFDRARHD